jgi:hypothetical protein
VRTERYLALHPHPFVEGDQPGGKCPRTVSPVFDRKAFKLFGLFAIGCP